MRRILLTLLIAILSVPIAWADETGGATVVRAEYFFDSDPGYGNATIINNVTEGDNNLSLSVERLLPGAHMLYVRSQASTGVWSSTQSHPLLILRQRPTEAVRVEYFYDTDPGYGNGKSVGNLTDGDNTLVVSVAGLAYGVHHLCLRAQDNTGVWSQVATSSIFVTSPQTANAIRVEYFFDTDPGFGQGTPITPSQDETATYALSLDGLSMGAHVLNLRVQDNHGRWSAVQQHPIYVLSNLPDVVAAEYFFDDNDPGEGQATAVPLPNVKTDPFAFEANTAGLAPGEHHLMVRLKKNNGFWTLYDAATFTVDGPAEPEHYAVLTDNTDVLDDSATGITYGKTLTFYYDTEKQARGGMDIGPFADSSERGWFEQRKTITSVVFDESFANDTTLTSTSYWFSGLEKLTTITNMRYLNTAKVTDMNHMFMYCYALKQIDLTNFNTANVVNMNSMFLGSTGLEQLNLTMFSTEKVTDMSNMFSFCEGLRSVDLSSFNTSAVTTMEAMFNQCVALETLDVRNFDTHNVTNMSWMFNQLKTVSNLDLTHFNTENVTNMYVMFSECNSMSVIDLSSFNTLKVENMNSMFHTNPLLKTIFVGDGWTTENVVDSEGMFVDCPNIVGGKGTAFDADHIDKAYAHIDGGASNPGYLTDKNAPAEPEHYAVLADNDIVINPEGAALPGKTLTFFYDTKKAERSGMSVGPFDLPQNREWESLLQNITTVQFDESMANDTTVTSTAYWFYGCQNLEYVYGTENLKTQNVTDMKYMFYDCNVLQEVNLSGFNTANVTDMTGMFYKCHSLQTIDLTNFNTSKVTNMSWMFYNCSAVTKIYAGSYWTTTAVRESEDMFVNCTHVVGSAGTTYDANHVDAAYAHIDGGPSNPGYLSDKNAPVVPDPEPYVVLDSTTMTFYYDTEMNSRQGMPIVAGGATVTWGNYAGGITNVVFTSSFAEYLPVSTASWFSGFKSLTTITGIENLKTDSVKSMRSMFQGCGSLIHIDMSQFNTSKVEDFGYIFNSCSSLAAIQAGYAMIPAEEYARVDNPNLLLYVNEPSLAPQSVQNVVVRDFAKTIILTDEVGASGNNNFYAPKSFTAEMISYSHEYRQQTVNGISRGWESIVLPFTVQTIVNERNGVIAPFGNSASELHFWLRQLISDGIVRATQIEANKAYIISMPNNEEEYPAKYNQNGRVTFSSENALVPAIVIEGVEGKIASGEIVTLMPNFQKKYANENFYALNVGEERLYNGTSYPEGSVFERGYRAVRPFEAYTIHHGSSPAPQFISIADITNGDNLTGINDAIRLNDEQMINDKWYDLNGQQLQKKPTRKGVYLHNGRKVIIR